MRSCWSPTSISSARAWASRRVIAPSESTTNQLRARAGVALQESILQGTLERVRPILMTSATTVLGMLPLVLFSESDANIWNALAFTLIGGMISSTLLVLTVTPALYILFERRRAARLAATAVALTPTPVPAGDRRDAATWHHDALSRFRCSTYPL